MKRFDLLSSMNGIDDKFIEEAAPDGAEEKKKRKGFNFYSLGALAACIAIMVTALNLWLFLPFYNGERDITAYSDSEYYPIIQKLNAYRANVQTAPLNNFERYFANLFSGAKAEDGVLSGMSPEGDYDGTIDDGGAGNGTYEEITDNQVDGVIEADLIKRSDKHIYYLNHNELNIYSIAGEDSALLGSYTIDNTKERAYYTSEWEFYLSSDCTTVTVIAPYFSNGHEACIAIIALDVTDPAAITLKNTVAVKGSYISSRLTDGSLLLINQFLAKSSPDYSKPSDFIPQIDTGDGVMQCIPIDAITAPDAISSLRYTVVSKLDIDTLELYGSRAFLSYSEELYVSDNAVYATRDYIEREELDSKKGLVRETAMTEISVIDYSGHSLEYKGSASVEGYVKDQYSLDEYEGRLRIVTTTSQNTYFTKTKDNASVLSQDVSEFRVGTNASLYVIALDSFEVLASVESFAPEGEVVQSVRFDRNNAYVCTSVYLSDPVFFFDLADLENITYKDTGTIDGFSSSLVNFGDGYLLGIGVGDTWNTLKVEIYEETEDGVRSVCKYEHKSCSFSDSYKSYYIDRERGLVGFGISAYNTEKYGGENGRYILILFDEYRLFELVNINVDSDNYFKRAFYDDGYLYVLGPSNFEVVNIG